jgi:hypothetical protein
MKTSLTIASIEIESTTTHPFPEEVALKWQ